MWRPGLGSGSCRSIAGAGMADLKKIWHQTSSLAALQTVGVMREKGRHEGVRTASQPRLHNRPTFAPACDQTDDGHLVARAVSAGTSIFVQKITPNPPRRNMHRCLQPTLEGNCGHQKSCQNMWQFFESRTAATFVPLG